MPVGAVVQPRVQRRPLAEHRFEPADGRGDEPERRSEQRALEPPGRGLRRRDPRLVGEARGPGAEGDEPVRLGDDVLDPERASLGRDRGRRLVQPDELRMGVRQARACLAALVDERVHVGEALRPRRLRPAAPCLRDEVELAVVELAQRVEVLGRVHDDLLPLERGVEVGEDADAPGLAEPQRLGRRPLLPAGAERAARALVLDRPEGARPGRAPAGDGDEPARQRIAPQLAQALTIPRARPARTSAGRS